MEKLKSLFHEVVVIVKTKLQKTTFRKERKEGAEKMKARIKEG